MTESHRSIVALLGRRGMVLVILGVIYLGRGIGLLASGINPVRSGALHDGVDVQIQGAIWLATGAVAVLVGATRRRRDAAGFVALSIVPILLTLSYFISWILYVLPVSGPQGLALGFVNASIYGAMTFLITVIAGWPNPEPHPPGFPPEEATAHADS